jgi:L-fucose isomerase
MADYPHSFDSLPRIGIRPAIDGRYGGVRESLEDQTMGMARRVAKFISENLRYPTGDAVECVLAPSCIGGVSEARRCQEHFRAERVGVSLTVTPCWAYGSETMDMDPVMPKAVWGFNGTERPGAVYLAAVLAGHTQKGIPAFGIYGKDVQDSDDESIPEDVQEKLLRFCRAGLAVALMKGRAYLSMGGTSMGIAGSMVDSKFWEKYLGMRVESVDMAEVAGRIKKGLYDPVEYEKALAWTKEHCVEGKDYNIPSGQRSRESLDQEWEDSVKMALVARDLLVGNPRLKEIGYPEPSSVDFKGNAVGPTIFPMGIFWKRY